MANFTTSNPSEPVTPPTINFAKGFRARVQLLDAAVNASTTDTGSNVSNLTDMSPVDSHGLFTLCVIAIILALIILVTIVGNIFVMLAIALEKDLRRPQYYLIFSLALADLLVGVLVLPFSAMYEIQQEWLLGSLLCDAWCSADVLLCTASILHLVLIALDRYWSVTDVLYSNKRTASRIMLMLLVIWLLSAVISLAPLFGWKDAQTYERLLNDKQCLISQDLVYQICSTSAAFFLPLLIILILYYKIYKEAKSRIRRKDFNKNKNAPQPKRSICVSIRECISKIGNSSSSQHEDSVIEMAASASQQGIANNDGQIVDSPLIVASDSGQLNGDELPEKGVRSVLPGNVPRSESSSSRLSLAVLLPGHRRQQTQVIRPKQKMTLEQRRERKAFTTLAIVTGTFIASWKIGRAHV